NRKLFRELVEDAALALRRRIQTGDLDASNRITNIEKTAGLAALAVHGERVPDGCLNAETIEHGAKDFVVIEAVDQRLVQRDFIGHGSVDHALVEVGGAQSPRLAGEQDVVTVVDLREMVKGTRLFGIRHGVAPPVVLDGDVAFFDINIG